MKWKGKNLKTYSEIIDYALSLKGDEQKEFIDAYAQTGPYALQNVGYFSGYYGPKKAQKIMAVFKTAHPIFGRRSVSAREAFRMGKSLGRLIKEKRS